jgi:hypothetical protein
MTKTLRFMALLGSIIACACMVSDASADGIVVRHHPKKVRTIAVERLPDCAHHRCFLYRRPPCPGGYGCYSLYGAYGPFGGPAYRNRFSY